MTHNPEIIYIRFAGFIVYSASNIVRLTLTACRVNHLTYLDNHAFFGMFPLRPTLTIHFMLPASCKLIWGSDICTGVLSICSCICDSGVCPRKFGFGRITKGGQNLALATCFPRRLQVRPFLQSYSKKNFLEKVVLLSWHTNLALWWLPYQIVLPECSSSPNFNKCELLCAF